MSCGNGTIWRRALLFVFGAFLLAACQETRPTRPDGSFLRYRRILTPETRGWKAYAFVDAFEYDFTVYPGAKMIVCPPIESDRIGVESREEPVNFRLLVAAAKEASGTGKRVGAQPELTLLGLVRYPDRGYERVFSAPLRSSRDREAAATFDLKSGGFFYTAADDPVFPVMWKQLFRLPEFGWFHYHLVPVDAELSPAPCEQADS